MTPRPHTAVDLAESPSVRISVQFSPFLVPASLASSSFGIPLIFVVFLPPLLSKAFFSLNSAKEATASTIPDFNAFL